LSSRTVLRLLHQLGYSLQANAKVTEGRKHEYRDAQFRYVNDMAARFIDDDQPAISVDANKKGLIGDFANGGTECQPAVNPNGPVCTLRRPRPRKVVPYGDLRRPTVVEPDGAGPVPQRRATA
jgi:hypothetical protein